NGPWKRSIRTLVDRTDSAILRQPDHAEVYPASRDGFKVVPFMSFPVRLVRREILLRGWSLRVVAIPAALLALIIALALRTHSELGDAMSSIRSADLRWMVGALAFQVIALSLIAANYRRI